MKIIKIINDTHYRLMPDLKLLAFYYKKGTCRLLGTKLVAINFKCKPQGV